jgi:N-acetylmuramoyl-L-alanine amidase
MKHYKHSAIAFIAVILLGVPWLINSYPQSTNFIDSVFYYAENNSAAVILRNIITMNQLQDKYNAVTKGEPKIRILIVPGHEPNYGGAEYRNLKERDLTVQLSKDLESFLNNNDHYEVVVTRNENLWNLIFQKYFDQNLNDIISFFKDRKTEMITLVNNGTVKRKTDGVYHNKAKTDVALRLYGINKWANENEIDIAIHIHLNDNPRKDISIPGEYSGIAIYVPEKQYLNSSTTRIIADSVFERLTKYNAASNLPKEGDGVVEDQDLIAIGSYNTMDAPSMLIEYGYIYEPQYSEEKVRDLIIKDLAFQTYLGIQDFFGSGNDVSFDYDTLTLPYLWKENLNKNSTDKEAILALQSALYVEKLYPGNGYTKNECPRTGKFGPCTLNSLEAFQNKYGITGEKGVVGRKTLEILNDKYSVKVI